MDDFREWLSDNLRYILLGLAIIVVLVIAFFAVKVITSRLGENETEAPSSETISETIAPTEAPTEQPTTEATNLLQTENQAILDIVTKYYNAIASNDIDELQQIGDPVDDESKAKILSNPIESFSNISIYYKAGLIEDSYNVYIYYEAKLPNIDQLIPSLGNLYLVTKEDGSLYVVDPQTHQDVADFMEKNAEEDADVLELRARVNSAYNDIVNSNPDLDALIKKIKQPETEVDIPDAGSVDVHVSTSVTVTGNLNVRADSRQDSDQIGTLIPGQTVTRLEVLDNGWSKIRFDDGAGTIVEGYVLSEYLQENGADNTQQ